MPCSTEIDAIKKGTITNHINGLQFARGKLSKHNQLIIFKLIPIVKVVPKVSITYSAYETHGTEPPGIIYEPELSGLSIKNDMKVEHRY